LIEFLRNKELSMHRSLRVGILFCLVVAVASSSIVSAQSSAPPRVRLVATGGTISNASGGRLSAEELIEMIPTLTDYVQPEFEQFANTSSSSITLEQWLQLARRINELYRGDPELAGVVVTSGTDTLEEIAYFLHLAVRDPRPVVIVGAMRNPSTLGYEGAANLLQAFRVAADPASRDKGALVVMNDEINSAREVTKTNAVRLQTFETRGYGILGVVDRDRVVYYRDTLKRHTAASEFDVFAIEELPRVDILMVWQGATADLIEAAANAGARGIVMATAGAGATSGNQRQGITAALEQGVFVVTSTRTGSGRIAARRGGGRGRGGATQNASLRISSEDLAPLKARILLMLALATTDDGAQIQRMFQEY
jgi:L-asparaginase